METGHLKAGVAESPITPVLGSKLAVEFSPQTAASVRTPLLAKALLLANQQTSLALVTLDLYGLVPGAAARLQRAIATRCGLAAEAVIIVCSHTRGGPYTTPVVGEAGVDETALQILENTLPDLVARAKNNLQEASLGFGRVVLPHLVYNHRLLTRNMKAVSAWLGVPKNEVLAPEGPIDPEFSVLVLRDPLGFPICLVWNFAADNRFPEGENGSGVLSAGLPHFVQQQIDARTGKHIPLFYLPGCGGNTSFVHGLEQSADAVASAVMAAYLETSCDPQVRLDYRAETVILPIRDYSCLWSQADIELKAPQVLEAYTREMEILQKEGAQAIPAQINVFRLGNYALAALPGMPFIEFGLAIKEHSPAQATLVAANTGGHLGYIITRQAFENEGFEAWPARSALIGPGGGEFIAEQATLLVEKLWRR